MDVRRIKASDTYPIRHLMLRPDRPFEECHYKGDNDSSSFHLGAFVEKRLVSIASFFFDNHPDISKPVQYRLRGMATLIDYQKQGLGEALLKTAFPLIKQNQATLLWCNARLEAKAFYEKVGFHALTGKVFDIDGIGPHVLMYKDI